MPKTLPGCRRTNSTLSLVAAFVAYRFYVFREMARYTVFLSGSEPVIAYGVLALASHSKTWLSPASGHDGDSLAPFKGQIVYDGLISRFNISFGPGIRRSLNDRYKEAKARHGIVTSLPILNEARPPKAKTPRPAPKPPSREDKDQSLDVIVGLMDQFCAEHLNEEYAVLCRRMAEKLARKRPSPLLQGSPNAWASGIVRAVGGVNFLHDKAQSPYMRSTDIDKFLGTSASSGAAKLAAIRKMLKIYQMDPAWSLPSRLVDNPMTWMVQVNGFITDLRHAPRELQEVAFNKGLIPYIPADRPQEP
ncbi:MAG: DUF6398 domain-containing protein [Planctomycetaceae bacterium]